MGEMMKMMMMKCTKKTKDNDVLKYMLQRSLKTHQKVSEIASLASLSIKVRRVWTTAWEGHDISIYDFTSGILTNDPFITILPLTEEDTNMSLNI